MGLTIFWPAKDKNDLQRYWGTKDKIRSPARSFSVMTLDNNLSVLVVASSRSSAMKNPKILHVDHGKHKMNSFLAISFSSYLVCVSLSAPGSEMSGPLYPVLST